MGDRTKPPQTDIPSIKITLTTFIDDKNGEVACSMRGTVKIDGEEEGSRSKEVILNSTLFKYAIIKNFFVLSFGQFLLFMAFDSLSNLQSTINDQEGLGLISLAVTYGGFTISSLFLPPVIIRTWGCKKTMVLTAICFCPYILANINPTWSTLIPSAFICGLASGPLWCARSTYLNQISHKYAKVQRISVGIMNAWFFSFCTTFRQNTDIWGNLVSHYTLRLSQGNNTYSTKDMEGSCGPDFCDYEAMSTNHSFNLPPEDRRYILIAIFAILALMAALLMAFFLDPLDSGDCGIEKYKFSSSDFLVTLYQLIDTDQILLLPLTLYTGLVDGFYSGDYKKAYVSCAWGMPHVSAVSICYGVIGSLVDSACGPCVMILGRAGLFLLAAFAHFSMFVALILWTPNSERTAGFFLVASAHGIANGIWMSQVVALYGVLFKSEEEVGFSCYYFLNSLGYLLAYSYSKHLCTRAKLYIPLAVLVVGMVLFFAVEVRLFKRTIVEYSLRNKHRKVFD